ncbi:MULTISPECIES: hypothetical protein [Pseudomonas]|jgi:succinate dehydrogenase/fumarate reductase cytochrome b subunit|uniref:Uncharacterized protein n=1 Tax=Pseudomonas hygromyciniae TaxID=2812000 RepID=A0ABX7JTQ5_9PSED|nr:MULTISPECIES: hypothetical protein [Pseudomonas]MBN0975942.1 hypothetical protein [Pseudomonas hygromyciniae]MDD1135379.1 hypothetical protein [Pseudomonas shahriarae]QSB37737.1 hypothetical protein JTY93_15480 [Pseudomonas hygromyciniae]
MSLSGIADQMSALGAQFPMTMVVAGVLTYALLAGYKRSYASDGKWIVALLVLLALWAFFPHGYNALFASSMPERLFEESIKAPSQKALFFADIFWTVLGALIGWFGSSKFDHH